MLSACSSVSNTPSAPPLSEEASEETVLLAPSSRIDVSADETLRPIHEEQIGEEEGPNSLGTVLGIAEEPQEIETARTSPRDGCHCVRTSEFFFN